MCSNLAGVRIRWVERLPRAARVLTAAIVVAAGFGSTSAGPEAHAKGGAGPLVGASIDQPLWYTAGLTFVDAIKTAQPFTAADNPYGAFIATDPEGWPKADFAVVVHWDMDLVKVDIGGTYSLSFQGKANVSSNTPSATVSKLSYNAKNNTTTGTIQVAKKAPNLVLAFRNTSRGAGKGAGVTGLKLIRPGYSANSKDVFTKQFLDKLKPFQVIRLMDFTQTNNSVVSNWKDRPQVIDPTVTEQSKLPDGTQISRGAAFEYGIQLANALGKDLWVNIPDQATDSGFVQPLAQLLKSKLKGNLKVYLEYGNEMWNPQFTYSFNRNLQAAIDDVNHGVAPNAPLNYKFDRDGNRIPDSNQYYWAMRRVARRIKEIGGVFTSAFGKNSFNSRIRPILASQAGGTNYLSEQLAYLRYNFGPPAKYIYGAAIAPYFGPDQSSYGSADQIVHAMISGVNGQATSYPRFYTLVHNYGVKLVAYEGGTDTTKVGNGDMANQAENDPRMKDLIFKYMSFWYGCGGDLFTYYKLSSNWNKFGRWGLLQNFINTTAKYEGMKNVISKPETAFLCPDPSTLHDDTRTYLLLKPGTGTGLNGTYFEGINFNTKKMSRVDELVSFDYGYQSDYSRSPLTAQRDYSVRWSGSVMAPSADTYTFTFRVSNTDGGRILLNGKKVAENWEDCFTKNQCNSKENGPKDIAAPPMKLKAGQKVKITLEYYHRFPYYNDGAQARLFWETKSLPRSIVPTPQLFTK